MSTSLRPLADHLGAAARLGRAALLARDGPGPDTERSMARWEASLRDGDMPGRLLLLDEIPSGVVFWGEPSALGASLELLYLEPAAATSPRYDAFLSEVEQLLGPIAFVAGPFDGLDAGAESALMLRRGYAAYGRTEMRLAPEAELPEPVVAPPLRLRRAAPRDQLELARLHARAYRGLLDRYLFWNDPDDDADARRHVTDLFAGRWGPLIPDGSWVAEDGDRIVGAVLSLRTDAGALIGDVMVDPDRQRTGVGRACLLASLRAMRAAREPPAYLNVTEGNESALHLYGRVGFVRSLRPTRDWYNTARVPVPPAAIRGSSAPGRLGGSGLVREPSQSAERH